MVDENLSLFFRSDTREPQEIFQTGMWPRNPLSNGPQARVIRPETGFFDVNPGSAVSVTRDLNAAPIFPRDPNVPSWLYVVELPHRSITNVHAQQYLTAADAFQMLAGHDKHAQLRSFFDTLAGQESAVRGIPNTSIVCAARLDRRLMMDYSPGAPPHPHRYFKVDALVTNPHYQGSPELAAVLHHHATEMANERQWQATPYPGTGFVRSDANSFERPALPTQGPVQRPPQQPQWRTLDLPPDARSLMDHTHFQTPYPTQPNAPYALPPTVQTAPIAGPSQPPHAGTSQQAMQGHSSGSSNQPPEQPRGRRRTAESASHPRQPPQSRTSRERGGSEDSDSSEQRKHKKARKFP